MFQVTLIAVAIIVGLYITIKVRRAIMGVCAWIGGIGSAVASEVKSTKDIVVAGTKEVWNHDDIAAARTQMKEDWKQGVKDISKRKAIVVAQSKAGIRNGSVQTVLVATKVAQYITKKMKDTVQVDQKLITRG